VEGAAFFALSLVATAPIGDPELRNQKQSAALLERGTRSNLGTRAWCTT